MSDSVSDNARFVIKSGVFEGDAIPGKIQNLDRRTFVEGNVTVNGSILSGDIAFRKSPFTVMKSVCSRGEIKFENLDSRCSVHSNLFAKSSILVDDSCLNQKGWLAIYGDVHGKMIKLNRCVVYGNIFAKTAILDNCSVLGLVKVQKTLRAKNSILGAFYADSAEFGAGVKILYPYSFSKIMPEFHQQIQCLSLVDLKELFLKKDKVDKSGLFSLGSEDVVQASQRMLEGEAGDLKEITIKHLALGPGARLLDLSKMESVLEKNSEFIQTLVLRDMLDPKAIKVSLNDDFFYSIEAGMLKVAVQGV